MLRFQEYYVKVAQPFQWKFTRRDLERLMAKLSRILGGLTPRNTSSNLRGEVLSERYEVEVPPSDGTASSRTRVI